MSPIRIAASGRGSDVPGVPLLSNLARESVWPSTPQGTRPPMSEPRLRDTWVLRKHEASVLVALYAAFTAVWFANHRTSRMNSLTYVGSMMSDTLVKIIVTALVAVTMLIVWKRWLEPL